MIPIGALVLLMFIAMLFGGVVFVLPILTAASQRLAGRIRGEGEGSDQDLIRLQESMNDLERRVRQLQEQHDFLEKLVQDRPRLPAPGRGDDPQS